MIALGVTGHRRLAEVGKVAAGVDRAFEHVVAAFGSMPAAVVSCLAEGADRLVVQRALALGVSTLVAVLPLPADDYVDDFVSPDSKHEFRSLLARADRVIMSGPTGTRTEAYAAAGYALVNASRILLAVWDGEQARGRGGTGTVTVERLPPR